MALQERRVNTMKARKWMTVAMWVLGALVGLVILGWLGLQVQPAPFPEYEATASSAVETMPLPAGLPAPVERFYRTVYGDSLPIYTSAVLTGRATIAPVAGIKMPARYRFVHQAGRDYRHYIEACWFGIPFLKVNERYVDGESLIEIPGAGKDSGPKVEWSANQGLWAESWQFPSLFVTDTRVKWLPIDDETAILDVPFKDQRQQFVVRFDPRTGLPTWTETMRYHASSSPEKTLWMTRAEAWGRVDGILTNTVGSATWMDNGKPWATFRLEEARFNTDVSAYVRAKGL
jgi:hypothetical protein